MYQKSKSIRIKQYCHVDQMLDRWWIPNKDSLSSQDLQLWLTFLQGQLCLSPILGMSWSWRTC